MEGCVIVERDLDKVISKFNEVQKQSLGSIDETIVKLLSAKAKLLEAGDNNAATTVNLELLQCLRTTEELVNKLSSEHKDLHGNVSKVGKDIDKNFISDFSPVMSASIVDSEENQRRLHLIISEHFLRHGLLTVSDSLSDDALMEFSENEEADKVPFVEMHAILESLRSKNVQPALAWVSVNREQLRVMSSCLEFKLHRLQFIELLKVASDNQAAVLAYARNLAPFASQHPKELQALMGALLYMRQGLEQSPYASLLNPVNWDEVIDLFTKTACTLLGFSVDSPLNTVVRAGCKALPPLLSLKQVMQQKQCSNIWTSRDELPVEINMGPDAQFHSIFACPILRQQTSDNNPPMRLLCGHVISRDAINKMSNASNKVKCPYCPVEQMPSDARQIHF